MVSVCLYKDCFLYLELKGNPVEFDGRPQPGKAGKKTQERKTSATATLEGSAVNGSKTAKNNPTDSSGDFLIPYGNSLVEFINNLKEPIQLWTSWTLRHLGTLSFGISQFLPFLGLFICFRNSQHFVWRQKTFGVFGWKSSIVEQVLILLFPTCNLFHVQLFLTIFQPFIL